MGIKANFDRFKTFVKLPIATKKLLTPSPKPPFRAMWSHFDVDQVQILLNKFFNSQRKNYKLLLATKVYDKSTSKLARMLKGRLMNCWCYIVNESYILPALVSASQLRRSLKCDNDEILIISIGEPSKITTAATRIAAGEGVTFAVVSSSILRGMPMYCARLFISEFMIGSNYKYITYIDADTQIVGPTNILANANPPSGSILAVPDIMSMTLNHPSRHLNSCDAYFHSIGVKPESRPLYFNSGLMKFSLNDWEAISKECIHILRDNGRAGFRFPDQDALNLVLGGAQTLISFKWNYPAFFIGQGIDDIVKPNIVHFMSRPRPWDGAFSPWGTAAFKPYQILTEAHPELACLFNPMRNRKWIRYTLQQFYKSLTENWGSDFFRDKIYNFEATAPF